MAATLIPLKSELRVYLNNGTTTTGAVKTVTVKLADLNPTAISTATTEQLALLMALSTTTTDIFTKTIYQTAITSTSQLTN